jgi:uncharacterized protein with GYD domain
MATYILLGTLTDEGREKLRKNPGWVNEVRSDLEATGIKVLSQYAVLGEYDIVTIIDAPDNKTAVHVSSQLTLKESLKIITLPAIPIKDFLTALK